MPALLALSIPFFAFAAAIVLIGLSQTHTAAHGSSSSQGFWQFLSSGLLRTLLGQIAQAGRWVVSHFAAAQLDLLAKWLVSIGTLTSGWFAIEAAFAEAVVGALERLEHRGDPRARRKAAAAGAAAAAAAKSAHRANSHAGQVGHSLTRYKSHANPRIAHATHAVDVTLPRSIGRVRTREEALSRDQAKLKERTRSLEDGAERTWEWIRTHPLTGVTGAFAGAVAIALARLGFGFLRCRNWQRVGKRLTCGMGAWVLGLLDLIAGFGLATLAVEDPEALARATVAAVDTVEPILAEILRR